MRSVRDAASRRSRGPLWKQPGTASTKSACRLVRAREWEWEWERLWARELECFEEILVKARSWRWEAASVAMGNAISKKVHFFFEEERASGTIRIWRGKHDG